MQILLSYSWGRGFESRQMLGFFLLFSSASLIQVQHYWYLFNKKIIVLLSGIFCSWCTVESKMHLLILVGNKGPKLKASKCKSYQNISRQSLQFQNIKDSEWEKLTMVAQIVLQTP